MPRAVTRRRLLQHVTAVAVAATRGPSAQARTHVQAASTARDVCDHLMLGAADLDVAIGWVEAATGVRAVPGGSHPGVGTRNALLSLGGRQYLEILAPDPHQPRLIPHYGYLRELQTPRLVGWAAQMQDGDALAARLRSAGLDVSGPTPAGRGGPPLDDAEHRRRRCATGAVLHRMGCRRATPVRARAGWMSPA